MSADLVTGLSMFFSQTWKFFSDTMIPGTTISVGVLYLGMLIIPIAFSFISIITGHSIGESDSDSAGFGSRSSKKTKISDKRKNDVR